MNEGETDALGNQCRRDAGDGHLELFKTTMKYDGKEGWEQHHMPSEEATV